MTMPRCRSGVTLPDLIITLAILAILAVMAAPRLRRAGEAMATRSARDAAATEFERARVLALARGTARVIVDPAAAEIRVEAPAGLPAGPPLRLDGFATAVTVDGLATGTANLDFNAIGLGVSANRTIRFRRGQQESRLSLSIYGRVRRW
jgi:type II secretory pathway pseudopilin PulG